MKHRDLITKLEAAECVLLRHGGRHDIYHNPRTGASQPVPRHREVNELLAKKIIRDLTRDDEKEKQVERAGAVNPHACGTSVMTPAFSASRAGVTPEASGHGSSGTFAEENIAA